MEGLTIVGNRIVEVQLLEHSVPLQTKWHVLSVMCSDGSIGLGECSDVRAVHVLTRAVNAIRPTLLGRDLDTAADVLAGLLARRDSATDRAEAFCWSTLAGALDCALLDIHAQQSGVPLTELLVPGSTAVELGVSLYANLNREQHDRSPEAFARAARTAESTGFGAVKIAPFDGPHRTDPVLDGLAIVRAVRGALRQTTRVLVDVHHRLTRPQLDRVLPDLEDCGVDWLEDAVDVLDTEAVEALGRDTTIPLAGGEQLWQASDVGRACRSGTLSYLLIDPKHVGGPGMLPQLLAQTNGTAVTFHNPSGPVGTALSAHLTPLRPDATLVEYAFGQTDHRVAVVRPTEHIMDGRLTTGHRPGLGVSLVEDAWTVL